jgi:hypothetical protein
MVRSFALASLIVFPSVALATTRTVTNLNDAGAGSLRATLAVAVDGDVVNFDPGLFRYTITLTTGELTVSENITIDGADANILVSGNKASRVLHVLQGAVVTVNGLGLREGSVGGSGGCLYNEGTLTLNDVSVEECTATAGGGGIRNDKILTLNRSTVSENTAINSFGGGIDNVFSNAALTLVNSTVSGNTAGTGGGIDNYGAGATATLIASTIANNRAANVGGGIHAAEGSASAVSLKQTLVANNTAATIGVSDCSGTLSSADYNLITNLPASPVSNDCQLSDTTTHNVIGLDPRLGALQANGSRSIRTQPLRPGSPAIDAIPAVDCAAGNTVDARGLARPQDGDADATASCDIGAYEARKPIVVNSLLNPSDPGKCTLRDAIAAANTNAAKEGCAAGNADVLGDRIVFSVTGRITAPSSGDLAVTGSLLLDGPGADRLTISAERGALRRVLRFSSSCVVGQERQTAASLAVAGLTLADGIGQPGGGIYFSQACGYGRLAIDRVAFEDNTANAGSEGGGLWVDGTLYRQIGVEIDNSSFSNTIATSAGPHLHFSSSLARISNTTIGETRSDSALFAGAFQGQNVTRIRLINSTVVGSEPVGGLAFKSNLSESATIEYRNSIIAGHGTALATQNGGALESRGYNIVDDDSGPPAATGDLKSTDPKVALHLYGGGPTRTIAPLPGSPAIDRIPADQCAVLVDQRGVQRPINGDRVGSALCDSGAFETAPPIIVDSLLDPTEPSKCTLRDAIEAANTNAAVSTCPAGLATAPDLITFGVNGTIPIAAPLVPTGSVAIRGPGATKLKIDGQGSTNAFVFGSVPNGDYALTGVSVENGSGAALTGGVAASGSHTFSLAETVLRNNKDYSFAAVNAGPVQILRSTITVNPGNFYQFLVQIKDGTAVIESSTVNDPFRNVATAGVLIQDSGGDYRLMCS